MERSVSGGTKIQPLTLPSSRFPEKHGFAFPFFGPEDLVEDVRSISRAASLDLDLERILRSAGRLLVLHAQADVGGAVLLPGTETVRQVLCGERLRRRVGGICGGKNYGKAKAGEGKTRHHLKKSIL